MRLSIHIIYTIFIALFVHAHLANSQVIGHVDLKRQVMDSVSLISISWSPEAEIKWIEENEGRLDIPAVMVSLDSDDLPKSNTGSNIYQIDIRQAPLVEWMVKLETLASGESIVLQDITTGRVIFDFVNAEQHSVLTPAFDPALVVLHWKGSPGSALRSKFYLSTVYIHSSDQGRGGGIGFDTALPCHINAACKEDSMLQVISKTAVRIRMVMEEGIGWCSGSFINNTRLDKTPYLLTAYHCQFDYTPIYDMWRFDLHYASTTCPNPDLEPLATSFTGCALIAGGQASDFLLVRLLGELPSHQDIVFAGWDRDDLKRPDTSYLIHHPNADIRKLSTCVNDATIHPNQISWTEGYTTPANHHFRLKFTEGGHQAGSSGGPLYNEDGYLVGQLHGGKAGCEDINNTYIGRLSKSWDPGDIPQERLKDWLDPDQTNLTRIASLPNLDTGDIVDMHGIITDPSGRPVRNALIRVTGATEVNLVTGDDGTFVLSQVSRSGQYILTPEKTDAPTNGVNGFDLIIIQKHLLGIDTFDMPWSFIAGDATNNNTLAVGDIVLLQRLLLGKIQTLPSSPSWRFDPPQIVIGPIGQSAPAEIPFMGIKIGDLNLSSDPGK